MPGPVSHIVFAMVVLSNFYNKWEQIKKEKSSFQAGFLFHSLTDKLYDEFMRKSDVYSKLPEIPKNT